MRRVAVVTCAAAGLLLALAAPAAAGGWAVASLDEVPAGVEAGERLPVGFTIRQHGMSPVDVEDVAVRIRSVESGAVREFPARSQGPVGHYVTPVRFPSAGAWAWEIEMGWFGPQPLGRIEVARPGTAAAPAEPGGTAGADAAPSASPAPAAGGGTDRGWLRGLLTAVAVAAGLLTAAQAVALARARRPVPAAP